MFKVALQTRQEIILLLNLSFIIS